VHRVNGIAVTIEGNPDSTMGAKGGLCGKGIATLHWLYDPNRINAPLKRTNPKKGIHEQGDFVEISWDEALDEIVSRIKKITADDPRKLAWCGSPDPNGPMMMSLVGPWGKAIGCESSYQASGAAAWCGNGAHHVTGQYYASWDAGPDWKYCNYALFFGAGQGFGSGHAGALNMRLAAEARERGMKFVVFDPLCSIAGQKADEWIPLIPGTDGAVALAMINIILNELDVYDAPYIKEKTNGPYLIGADGLYIRDTETKKPLVWDPVEGIPKRFNDTSIKDFALFGEYEVNGSKGIPAFELIKEHVKQYTSDYAEKVSGVPANTINRIAKEMAEAACIGSTIVLDGVELPHRPVGVGIFRGGQGHTNSLHTVYAVHILAQILGAADVPGGTVALGPSRCFGDPSTSRPEGEPIADFDGMVTPTIWTWIVPRNPEDLKPPPEPQLPITKTGLQTLFTRAMSSPFNYSKDRENLWQKLGLEYRYEMILNWGANPIMSAGNTETIEDFLKSIPFFVDFELWQTETSEGFADIVLPDASPLEHTANCGDAYNLYFNAPIGYDDWSVHVKQSVIKPLHQRRSVLDVLLDLADQLGTRDNINDFMNRRYKLDEKHRINAGEKLTVEEMSDRVFRNNHGEDHGIDWFKEHGFLRWPKKPEEAYWRPFIDARVPIYIHELAYYGPKIKKLAEGAGVHANWEQYSGLVSWFPTPPHKATNQYDLYCLSYRDILHTGSGTMQLPLVDEASRMNPYTYNIVIHTDTAKQKGLADGDIIEIESDHGRIINGPIKISQGIHPDVIAIAATAGHWAKGQPIAYSKGVHFDKLIELDMEHVDPTNLNMETSVKVKIRNVDGGSGS